MLGEGEQVHGPRAKLDVPARAPRAELGKQSAAPEVPDAAAAVLRSISSSQNQRPEAAGEPGPELALPCNILFPASLEVPLSLTWLAAASRVPVGLQAQLMPASCAS